MCSVNSCHDEVTRENNIASLVGAQCRKCEEKLAKIVLQRKFPYCKECFLIYFSHKYNSGLGKTKLLRNGEKVLVAFSGSAYAVCLLDLIFHSLISDRKKKVKFEVEIIFIDERCDVSKEDRSKLYKSIKNLLRKYDYPLYYSTLFNTDDEILLLKNFDEESNVNFEHKLSFPSIKSESSRQDLILKLRTDVLFRAAEKLKCSKIFSAETSDHIAASIMSNLALGRGKQLPTITGMVDTRKDILLIRPIRECSKKEIIFYNIFNNLNNYNFISYLEKDKFSSIQKLSEIFVVELQSSFPSTFSTVVSTGNKLSVDLNTNKPSCILCQCALDSEVFQLSSLDALEISNMVSNISSEKLKTVNFTSLKNGCNDELESDSITSEELPWKQFCHSCKEIVIESASTEDNWLKHKLLQNYKALQSDRMHSEIKDFLI